MCTGLEMMAISQGVSAIGGVMRADDVADQQEAQASDLLRNTQERIRQTGKAQARRRSVQASAFSKAGVKMTGSAKRVMESQIQEDELELLKIAHQGKMETKAAYERASQSRTQGLSTLIQGGFQAASTYGKSRGVLDG